MDKTLVTKEHLEELGFKPCGRFWILENKVLQGSITYTEELTPIHGSGLNSLDFKCCCCVKLRNKKRQEVRFFTEELYVEDIISMMKILKTT